MSKETDGIDQAVESLELSNKFFIELHLNSQSQEIKAECMKHVERNAKAMVAVLDYGAAEGYLTEPIELVSLISLLEEVSDATTGQVKEHIVKALNILKDG
jgi:hypothetical protein